MTKFRQLFAGLAIVGSVAACSSEKPAEGTAEGAHAPPVIEHSSAGLPDGNVAAGEKLALAKRPGTGQSCAECHGKDGATPIDPSYPVLAGQYADYVAYALQMYRDGRRQHPLMSAQAKDLKDQDIADLASYFASRPRKVYDLSEHTDGK